MNKASTYTFPRSTWIANRRILQTCRTLARRAIVSTTLFTVSYVEHDRWLCVLCRKVDVQVLSTNSASITQVSMVLISFFQSLGIDAFFQAFTWTKYVAVCSERITRIASHCCAVCWKPDLSMQVRVSHTLQIVRRNVRTPHNLCAIRQKEVYSSVSKVGCAEAVASGWQSQASLCFGHCAIKH